MTSLNRVQLIYKIWKIVSLICLIACFVGAGGSFLGGMLLLLLQAIDQQDLVRLLLSIDEDIPVGIGSRSLGMTLIGMTIFLVAIGIVYLFQYQHSQKILAAGTPFTRDGVESLSKTGILVMCFSFGGSFIANIFISLAHASKHFSTDIDSLLWFGLLLFLLSFIFKYATEQMEELKSTRPADIPEDTKPLEAL